MSERFGRGIYGWWAWIGPRIRWSSKGHWTARWHAYRGGDEYCNDTVSIVCWPIGGVDVWWRWHQRTEADGLCDNCLEDPDIAGASR